MAIVKSRKSRENPSINNSTEVLIAVRVKDIILNEGHPEFKNFGYNDSIGTIYFTKLNDNTPLEKNWAGLNNIARPFFSFIKNYPLINEIVLLFPTYDKSIYGGGGSTNYYLPNLNVWNHPHHNALPSLKGIKKKTTKDDYEQTENGLTLRMVEDEGTDIFLGDYFNEQLNTKPLFPYEGDTIIEGRFGNSIRFGSTNFSDKIPENNKNPWSLSDTSKTGDPITIIRNGQTEETDEKGWIHTNEEINGDASSIYLCSNQQLTNLNVASLNQKSYGANIEPPITFNPIQFEELTRTESSGEITPEPPEDENLPEVIEEEPVITPAEPVVEEEKEPDELDDFDSFFEDDFVTYEIEDQTENQQITEDTKVVFATPVPPEIDVNQKIGKYYNLGQLIKTSTGLENYPGSDDDISQAEIIGSLKAVMINCIDKIKNKWPDMYITSAYRNTNVNKANGGSKTSQHRFGQAVDIQVPGVKTSEIFNWCIDNLAFDQLIWEAPERGTPGGPPPNSWIHISYKSGGNRKITTLMSEKTSIKDHYLNNVNGAYQNEEGSKYVHKIGKANQNIVEI